MEFIRKTSKEILRLKEYGLEDGSILPLLEYPLLEETGLVRHCFTTRLGGVSKGIFKSLNLSFTRGDEREAVKENFQRLSMAMGVSYGKFVFTDQTHTTNVRVVTEKDAGHGLTREKSFFDTDGLVTNVPGLILSTFYADCVPLYFVDKENLAVGLCHSGWRGTAGRIGKKVIEVMKSEYGTNPAGLRCAIGPSICQDCYEVSEDVAERFYREFPGHDLEILKDKGNGKYQLDLWKANEIVLKEAGVQPENMAVTNICTCCNPGLLFSHRASEGKRGNLGAFLSIKEEMK